MFLGSEGKISGSGYIIDDPGAKIKYEVEAADADNKVQFVLRAADNITWWKSIDLYVNVNGNWIHSKRIETKDDTREASVNYFDFEMTDAFRLEFWKGGFLGFGAQVVSLIMDSYANLGQRLIFTWEWDGQTARFNPSRPGIPNMGKVLDGSIVQGDGSSGRGVANLTPPQLYVVRSGQLHLIRDAREFRKAGYDRLAVQVIPDAELKKLPMAVASRLAPGEEIVLDLESFLGAGHYMTTYGVLRKTAEGSHVDAKTRTQTITMFGGFHGGVNMLYSDAAGFPVGMSATQRFGVDGTWVGRSDRTDYWSEDLPEDLATRTTAITLFHFWQPDQLDDVVRRGVDMVKPIVEIIKDVVNIGGEGKSSS